MAANVSHLEEGEDVIMADHAGAMDAITSMKSSLESLDDRVDPDAQATVTDYLDFTEYLPSDMIRSLSLIGKLDETYASASTNVHNLTKTWGRLPTLTGADKPSPKQLRADISTNMNRAVSSRVYAHSEAVRMAENVDRHYNRLKMIHGKLQKMLDNYAAAEELQAQSPVLTRTMATNKPTKITLHITDGPSVPKTRRARVPRITVPGEILAPYDIAFNTLSDDSDDSSDGEDVEVDGHVRSIAPRPPGQPRRIKVIKPAKIPKLKLPKLNGGVPGMPPGPGSAPSFKIDPPKPPPPNAVLGSEDAPWLRLHPYELSRLRKKMKKNAGWTPSESMIQKELKVKGREWSSFVAARDLARAEGRPFETTPDGKPITTPGQDTLAARAAPATASSAGVITTTTAAGPAPSSGDLSARAAEEAEESAGRLDYFAKTLISSSQPSTPGPSVAGTAAAAAVQIKTVSQNNSGKRKRESGHDLESVLSEGDGSLQVPQAKRSKTETPVPVPQLGTLSAHASQETPVEVARRTSGIPSTIIIAQKEHETKEPPIASPAVVVKEKKPASITTPAAAPQNKAAINEQKTEAVMDPPPRETRQRDVKKASAPAPIKVAASRNTTPGPNTTESTSSSRRPASSRRDQALILEPIQASLAADRPRRSSTAQVVVPIVEPKSGRRAKRPAPGVIPTDSGGNSAIGKRKAAPKKKRGSTAAAAAVETPKDPEIEYDDEGNAIDPDEQRYCLCNRVSFGVMISCENAECPYEWFHLECVGLKEPPARRTKWYCPDCRKALKVGEHGEAVVVATGSRGSRR